jgi:hypothetical protein
MNSQVSTYFPCAVFFRSGRTGLGIAVLLLQATLVFWPMASRLAREYREQSGMQVLLHEFSEKYGPPVELRGLRGKRFRQVA